MARAAESGLRPARLPGDEPLRIEAGPGTARVAIEGLRVEPVTRVGRRSGVRVVARVRVLGGRGRPLDYRVGFRLPSGVPVRSEASRYRDPSGRLLAKARTRPLAFDEAAFDDLWIFVPFGAFALPAGTHELEVVLSAEVGPGEPATAHGRFLLVQPETRAAAPPARTDPDLDTHHDRDPGVGDPEDPAAVEVTAVGTPRIIGCGVCHSEVVGAAWVCPRCRAVHHQDCWRFNGGCSAYGCGEPDRTGEPGRE